MTITAAQILAKVNNNLNRNETDIDNQIKEILQDLAMRGDFLQNNYSITATDSTASTEAPSLMKREISVRIANGEYITPITYRQYQLNIENLESLTEGEPTNYAFFMDYFYWWPIPDTGYAVSVDCYVFHAESTTVAFDDRFRAAIYAGATMAVARDLKGLEEQQKRYHDDYEHEIAILLATVRPMQLLIPPELLTTAATQSSITTAHILTKVNSNLKAFETDVNDQIKEILQDIGEKGDFIETSGTITAVDSTATTAAPDLMKREIELYISGGNYLNRITYDEYMVRIENQDSIIEGEPQEYAFKNDTFYWYPVPDTDYDVAIDYYKYHADSVTVEFADRFRSVIYAGVTMAVARDMGDRTEQFLNHRLAYNDQLRKLKGNIPTQPILVKYRDI